MCELYGILPADDYQPFQFRFAVIEPGDQQALVTATFSRRLRLRRSSGANADGRIKGKKLRPVCGDLVQVETIANEPELLITEILPRANELSRPDSRGRKEILAANLSYMIVVASDPPKPDWFIVDRYLSASELMSVPAAVVFNKIDLDGSIESARSALQEYAAIGYSTLQCSARSGEGIAELAHILAGETAIIVGQSGVGKSSIINRLIEDADQRIAAVSTGSGEGRHTTVTAVMLDLPSGGAVIDSPGVRDYAPATETAEEVIVGFREIADLGRQCRFANCRHLREPGCAVKVAVAAGDLSSRRYESYKRLMVLTKKLMQTHR